MSNKFKQHILLKQAAFEDYVNVLIRAFKEVIDPEHPYMSILQLITEGFIFSRWGFAGSAIALLLDKGFNINVKTVFETIRQVLGQHFQNNTNQTSNIDTASDNLTQQVLSTLGVSQTESSKTFEQIQTENPEIKSAFLLGNYKINKYSSSVIKKEAQLFGMLAKFSLVGFIKAIIKAALIGSGFNTAANVVVNNQNKQQSQLQQNNNNGSVNINENKTNSVNNNNNESIKNSILAYVGKASGTGTTYYNNNADINETSGKAWYILSEGKFDDYIMDWMFSVYQNMGDEVVNVIQKYLPQAIKIIRKEFEKWNPGVNLDQEYNEIRVPSQINNKELHCIKDLIDATLSLLKI